MPFRMLTCELLPDINRFDAHSNATVRSNGYHSFLSVFPSVRVYFGVNTDGKKHGQMFYLWFSYPWDYGFPPVRPNASREQ